MLNVKFYHKILVIIGKGYIPNLIIDVLYYIYKEEEVYFWITDDMQRIKIVLTIYEMLILVHHKF